MFQELSRLVFTALLTTLRRQQKRKTDGMEEDMLNRAKLTMDKFVVIWKLLKARL